MYTAKSPGKKVNGIASDKANVEFKFVKATQCSRTDGIAIPVIVVRAPRTTTIVQKPLPYPFRNTTNLQYASINRMYAIPIARRIQQLSFPSSKFGAGRIVANTEAMPSIKRASVPSASSHRRISTMQPAIRRIMVGASKTVHETISSESASKARCLQFTSAVVRVVCA